MEDRREEITLDDIKTYLLKEKIKTVIRFPIAIMFICLMWITANFLFKVLILDILTVITFLLGLIGTTSTIINIKKIKNNTYFRITTDVLVNKVEHISDGVWPNGLVVNRLFFKYNTYDILTGTLYYDDLYDMDIQAVFDTAFVGDIFTLVETKKKVVLVFNNKLFDVKID